MKLLEAVNVNPYEARLADDRWLQGYNAVARACAAHLEVQDACYVDGLIPIMGDINSNPGTYRVQPYAITGYLRNGTTCEQDDDEKWLVEVLPTKLNYILARSLVTQMDPLAQTWIGDAGVQTVALPGTSAAQLRTAVATALEQWERTVMDPEGPILHVPPSMVGDLQAAGLIMATGPGEISSGLVDKVVVSSGYEVATPKMFITGEIKVRLTGVTGAGGPLRQARLNTYTVTANQFAAMDVAPCAIVRIGA